MMPCLFLSEYVCLHEGQPGILHLTFNLTLFRMYRPAETQKLLKAVPVNALECLHSIVSQRHKLESTALRH